MFKVLTPVDLYHPRPVEFDKADGHVLPGQWVKLVEPKKYKKMGGSDLGDVNCRMSRVDTSKISTVGIDNEHEPATFTDANNMMTVMDASAEVRVVTDQLKTDTYTAGAPLTVLGGILQNVAAPTDVIAAYYEGPYEGTNHIVVLHNAL